MTTKEILICINAKVLCGENLLNRKVCEGYAGDMLSWVMSHLHNDQAWFTILNSINVIAVATLTDCPCVILTESVVMEEDVLKMAIEKDVVVLSTFLSTYEACAALSTFLGKNK